MSNASGGGRRLPKVLHRNRVTNTHELRRKFQKRYRFLQMFDRRIPSESIPQRYLRASGGDKTAAARAASKMKAQSKSAEDALKIYVTEIDKEYNRVDRELSLVAHGIDVYGNVARAEFRNFYPYLFCTFPSTWGMSAAYVNDEWLKRLREAIEKAARILIQGEHYTRQCAELAHKNELGSERLIRDMRVHWNIPACYFNCDRPVPMLKIECLHWSLVPVIRRICENPFGQVGIDASALHDFVPNFKQRALPNWVSRFCADLYNPAAASGDRRASPAMHTWEADKDYTMVFHADKQVCCSSWWRIWDAKVQLSSNYNVDVCYVMSHESVRAVDRHDPLVKHIPDDFIFFYDCEMMKLQGKQGFPRAELGDPVNQIGFQVLRMEALNRGMSITEAAEKGYFLSCVMSILPVKPWKVKDPGGENKYEICAINCESELEMLIGFEEILLGLNPTSYIAYNGNSFDWPYLIRRARMLRSNLQTKEAVEGRLNDMNINDYFAVGRDLRFGKGIYYRKAKKRGASLAASAKQDTDKVFIKGCQNLDLLCFVRQHKKFGLKGFSLDMVSEKFLGVQKLEIDHSRMFHMFMKPNLRQYVMQYCDRDVALMTRLVMAFDMFRFLRDISHMTMISWQKLIDRGAQYMILGLWNAQDSVRDVLVLYENAGLKQQVQTQMSELVDVRNSPAQDAPPRLVIPTGAFMVQKVEGPRSKGADEKFDGAVMVEPVPGLLSMVMTLDFASLYPSIMMEANIGPTTIVPHYMKQAVMRRVKEMCKKAHISTDELYYERTDNWYCTGEKGVPMQSLDEALREFESDSPQYDEEVRESLRPDYEYITDPDNKEYVEKWSPLAFNRVPDITDEEGKALSDEDKLDIFINVVQRVCRLTGRTKTRTRRKNMPHFVQTVFREDVYAHAERMLFNSRKKIKRDMGNAKARVQQLLQDGASKSDSAVKSGLLQAREYDVRQQAVKLIMNSVYGILPSMWKMKFTAECITDMGRMLIEETVAFSDTMICPKLGYMSNLKTVYGDTDSAFEKFTDVRYEQEFASLTKKLRNWPAIKERANYAIQYSIRVSTLKSQIKRCVEAGQITEKNASKVSAFITWKRLLHDCFERTDRPNSLFYIPSSMRADAYEPFAIDDNEREFFDYLMSYYDYILESVLGTSDVLRRVPDDCRLTKAGGGMNPPPLPTQDNVLNARHVHDALQWVFCQIFVEESEKIARVVNLYYARMYKHGRIVQEFEKLYLRILMTRKKKYGGFICLPGASELVCDVKGLTSVRGDSYTMKSYLCDELLNVAVREGDVDKCELLILETLRRVARKEVSLWMLMQSKGVKRHHSEYGERQPDGLDYLVPTKNMPPHIAASVLRNLLFDEDLPAVDTRVRFFVVSSAKMGQGGKVNASMSGSMPVWKRVVPAAEALRNYRGVHVDCGYYMNNLANLAANLLSPMLHNSTFHERYLKAEEFRRTRDKEERSEKVQKHFEKDIRAAPLARLKTFIDKYVYRKDDLIGYTGFLRGQVWNSARNASQRSSARTPRRRSAIIRYDEDGEGEGTSSSLSLVQLREIDKLVDAIPKAQQSSPTNDDDDDDSPANKKPLLHSIAVTVAFPDDLKRRRKRPPKRLAPASRASAEEQRAKHQKKVEKLIGDTRAQRDVKSFFTVAGGSDESTSSSSTPSPPVREVVATTTTTETATQDIVAEDTDSQRSSAPKTAQRSLLSFFKSANSDLNTCVSCSATALPNEKYCGKCDHERQKQAASKEQSTLKEQYDAAIRSARSSTSIKDSARPTSFLCLACENNWQELATDDDDNRDGNQREPEPFCRECIDNGEMHNTLYALNRYISPRLIEEVNVCARKCGDNNMVADPEDIVDLNEAAPARDQFFERNQDLKSCMTVGCPNIWRRAETDMRRKVIEYLCNRYL